MMALRQKVLFAAAIALGGLLVYDNSDMSWPPSWGGQQENTPTNIQAVSPGKTTRKAVTENNLQPVWLAGDITGAQFSEITLRPLFSPTRRPKPKPIPKPKVVKSVAKPVVKPKPLKFVLLGVIAGNTNALALISAGNDRIVHHVRTGDRIAGWTIAEIAPRQVAIERPGKRLVLPLTE